MDINPGSFYDALLIDILPYLTASEASAISSADPQKRSRLIHHYRSEMLSLDGDHERFAALTLYLTLFKKWQGRTVEGDLRAIRKFEEANDKCRRLNNGGLKQMLLTHTGKDYLMNQIIRRIQLYFGSIDACISDLDISLLGALGAGTNTDCIGTSFYTKLFSSPLTASTKSLLRHYQSNICRVDYLHAGGESLRSVVYGSHDNGSVSDEGILVDKNVDESRLIWRTGNVNMFYQKAIDKHIRACLEATFGINMSTQPALNQKLALIGSRDRKVATLDLTTASDLFSLAALELFCLKAPRLLSMVYSTRSTAGVLPDGTDVDFHMVCGMGNGYCSSLQTFTFAAIAAAVCDILNINWNVTNFGVFGDDIIVPDAAAKVVLQVLSEFGFKPSLDKCCYGEQRFRESCGVDGYSGHNVRGVYIRQLNTLQDCYTCINLLNEWSARTKVALPELILHLSVVADGFLYKYAKHFAKNAVKRLQQKLAKKLKKPPLSTLSNEHKKRVYDDAFRSANRHLYVPLYEGVSAGLRVSLHWLRRFQETTDPNLRVGSNGYRLFSPIASTHVVRDDRRELYQIYSNPDFFTCLLDKRRVKILVNPDGLAFSARGKHLSRSAVGFRQNTNTSYCVTEVSSPGWDYLQNPPLVDAGGELVSTNDMIDALLINFVWLAN